MREKRVAIFLDARMRLTDNSCTSLTHIHFFPNSMIRTSIENSDDLQDANRLDVFVVAGKKSKKQSLI